MIFRKGARCLRPFSVIYFRLISVTMLHAATQDISDEENSDSTPTVDLTQVCQNGIGRSVGRASL